MTANRQRTWLMAPFLLGAAALVSTAPAQAAPDSLQDGAASTASAPATSTLAQLETYALEGTEVVSVDQVTSVSQLTDVQPTDWAFQALQSLVERYGCIVGYPDRTYRGNRALSRYEFAAGLNACMDRINELIASATADLVRKEDLLVVQKLQEEFAAELATLRGRIDALEVRTTTLERQQFSTTTKLRGEVIFGIADTWGDSATVNGNGDPLRGATEEDNTQAVFADRVRLSFDSSFTGKDLLRTRINARNVIPFSGNALTGTNMTRLSYDGSENNAASIDKLYYRFPVGDNLRVQIDAVNNEVYDALISSLSPFESSGAGSISRFGRFNPVYRNNNPGNGSAGITFDWKIAKDFNFQAGYIGSTRSNDPTEKNGLFGGQNTAVAQLIYRPGNFTLGATYFRSYYPGTDVNLTGSTGTGFAIRPFGSVATSSDSFAATVQYKFDKTFLLGGWYGVNFAYQKSNSNEATVQNWAVYLAFPDLFKKGSLGGILFGMPPMVTSNDIGTREDEDTPFHLEGFYRYQINDNISLTPGVFVIFNPEGNSNNATQVVGVIRTTFTF